MQFSPEQQVELLENAKLRYQQEIRALPEKIHFSPQQSQKMLRQAEMMAKSSMQQQSMPHQLATTFSGHTQHHSKSSLSELQRIDLLDLKCFQRHVGKYVVVRVSTSTVKSVSVQMAVTSPSGASILITIYHYPMQPIGLGPVEASDFQLEFPIGTFLAIKEPYVKKAFQGEAFPFIRVDCPTDVEILSRHHPLVKNIEWRMALNDPTAWSPPLPPSKTVNEWKKLGNDCFNKRRYFAAFKLYSQGIEQHGAQGQGALLYLNRSAAALKLEKFASCLQDIETVLAMAQQSTSITEGQREKLLYRRAMAYYGLRWWEKAQAAFTDLFTQFPEFKEKNVWANRCAARLQEAKTGEYDINLKLYQELENASFSMHLDVADYVGPIRMFSRSDVGGGRGIQTTRNVKSGELLLAVKSVVAAFDNNRIPVMSLNFSTNKMDPPTHYAALNEMVYKLVNQPHLNPLILGLFDGTHQETEYSLHCPEDLTAAPQPVDVHRIENILHKNAFGNPGNVVASATFLFAQSSLFNHACFPNTVWHVVGDVHFIRAAQDIPKGTEVTLTYFVGSDRSEVRKCLVEFMDLSCKCPVCIEEKSNQENISKREQLIRTVRALPSCTVQTSPAKIEQALNVRMKFEEKILATYPPSPVCQSDMFALYTSMAFFCRLLALALKDDESKLLEWEGKALKFLLKSLACIGVEVASRRSLPISTLPRFEYGNAVRTLLEIEKVLADERGQPWVQAAFWVMNCTLGGDKQVFEHKFQPIS